MESDTTQKLIDFVSDASIPSKEDWQTIFLEILKGIGTVVTAVRTEHDDFKHFKGNSFTRENKDMISFLDGIMSNSSMKLLRSFFSKIWIMCFTVSSKDAHELLLPFGNPTNEKVLTPTQSDREVYQLAAIESFANVLPMFHSHASITAGRANPGECPVRALLRSAQLRKLIDPSMLPRFLTHEYMNAMADQTSGKHWRQLATVARVTQRYSLPLHSTYRTAASLLPQLLLLFTRLALDEELWKNELALAESQGVGLRAFLADPSYSSPTLSAIVDEISRCCGQVDLLPGRAVSMLLSVVGADVRKGLMLLSVAKLFPQRELYHAILLVLRLAEARPEEDGETLRALGLVDPEGATARPGIRSGTFDVVALLMDLQLLDPKVVWSCLAPHDDVIRSVVQWVRAARVREHSLAPSNGRTREAFEEEEAIAEFLPPFRELMRTTLAHMRPTAPVPAPAEGEEPVPQATPQEAADALRITGIQQCETLIGKISSSALIGLLSKEVLIPRLEVIASAVKMNLGGVFRPLMANYVDSVLDELNSNDPVLPYLCPNLQEALSGLTGWVTSYVCLDTSAEKKKEWMTSRKPRAVLLVKQLSNASTSANLRSERASMLELLGFSLQKDGTISDVLPKGEISSIGRAIFNAQKNALGISNIGDFAWCGVLLESRNYATPDVPCPLEEIGELLSYLTPAGLAVNPTLMQSVAEASCLIIDEAFDESTPGSSGLSMGMGMSLDDMTLEEDEELSAEEKRERALAFLAQVVFPAQTLFGKPLRPLFDRLWATIRRLGVSDRYRLYAAWDSANCSSPSLKRAVAAFGRLVDRTFKSLAASKGKTTGFAQLEQVGLPSKIDPVILHMPHTTASLAITGPLALCDNIISQAGMHVSLVPPFVEATRHMHPFAADVLVFRLTSRRVGKSSSSSAKNQHPIDAAQGNPLEEDREANLAHFTSRFAAAHCASGVDLSPLLNAVLSRCLQQPACKDIVWLTELIVASTAVTPLPQLTPEQSHTLAGGPALQFLSLFAVADSARLHDLPFAEELPIAIKNPREALRVIFAAHPSLAQSAILAIVKSRQAVLYSLPTGENAKWPSATDIAVAADTQSGHLQQLCDALLFAAHSAGQTALQKQNVARKEAGEAALDDHVSVFASRTPLLASLLPSPSVIMANAETPLAWTILRPLIAPLYAQETADSLPKEFISTSLLPRTIKFTCGVDTPSDAHLGLGTGCLTPAFVETFFRLQAQDITVPLTSYKEASTRLETPLERLKKEITNLNTQLTAATMGSLRNADPAQIRDRLQAYRTCASQVEACNREVVAELSRQKTHVESSIAVLKGLASSWSAEPTDEEMAAFQASENSIRPYNEVYEVQIEHGSRTISYCVASRRQELAAQFIVDKLLLPRCRVSPADATFCFEFIQLLSSYQQTLDVPFFSLPCLVNALANAVPLAVHALTPVEADLVGGLLRDVIGLCGKYLRRVEAPTIDVISAQIRTVLSFPLVPRSFPMGPSMEKAIDEMFPTDTPTPEPAVELEEGELPEEEEEEDEILPAWINPRTHEVWCRQFTAENSMQAPKVNAQFSILHGRVLNSMELFLARTELKIIEELGAFLRVAEKETASVHPRLRAAMALLARLVGPFPVFIASGRAVEGMLLSLQSFAEKINDRAIRLQSLSLANNLKKIVDNTDKQVKLVNLLPRHEAITRPAGPVDGIVFPSSLDELNPPAPTEDIVEEETPAEVEDDGQEPPAKRAHVVPSTTEETAEEFFEEEIEEIPAMRSSPRLSPKLLATRSAAEVAVIAALEAAGDVGEVSQGEVIMQHEIEGFEDLEDMQELPSATLIDEVEEGELVEEDM